MPELPMANHTTIFNQLQMVGVINVVAVSATKERPLFPHASNRTANETKFLDTSDLWINTIKILFPSSHDKDAIFMIWSEIV